MTVTSISTLIHRPMSRPMAPPSGGSPAVEIWDPLQFLDTRQYMRKIVGGVKELRSSSLCAALHEELQNSSLLQFCIVFTETGHIVCS